MTLASIVIPTFRRPDLLQTAIESCQRQQLNEPGACEILVVDNSPEASARHIVDAWIDKFSIPVRYLHVAAPGIARARNAGVAAARGTYLVFLDDDQEAASTLWLGAYLDAVGRGAKAVFGPVLPQFAAEADAIPAGAIRLFRRSLPARDGEEISRFESHLGSGNSVFEVASCFVDKTPFPVDLDGLGGEDSEFIAGLVRRGVPLFWAPDAAVIEHVPESRTTIQSLAQRSFRNGQIRSLIQFRSKESTRLGGVLWMVIGAAQAALYGCASVLLAPFRPDTSADLKLRASSGLGKVLWMKRFWHMSYPA